MFRKFQSKLSHHVSLVNFCLGLIALRRSEYDAAEKIFLEVLKFRIKNLTKYSFEAL
jgi:hypothetical protein